MPNNLLPHAQHIYSNEKNEASLGLFTCVTIFNSGIIKISDLGRLFRRCNDN